MRARALKSWAESEEGKEMHLNVAIHPTLETTHRFYYFGVWLYNFIQRQLPVLHHIYFRFLEWAGLLRRASAITGAAGFQEIVREVRPDVVVSTHPHLNHGFMELARTAMPDKVPQCVTYCGELYDTYGFSSHWVNPKIDLFIGAVEEVCRGARSLGVPEEQNWQGGFLLKPDFYQPPLSESQRDRFLWENFRLDPEQFTLVLATGANGANNHLRFLNALYSKNILPQVIVLCGRNPQIQMRVLQWASHHPEIMVRAVGFYTEMNKLLQAADAVVARPGTGTTSEAILSGCPIIFNILGGAMPQEMITMSYFKDHRWPKAVGRSRSLPNRVDYWMNHPEHLKHAREVMNTLNPPGNPAALLRRLCELAETSKAGEEPAP